MPLDKEKLYADFEIAGEDKVRENIAISNYGPPNSYKEKLAWEWLRRQEDSRVETRVRAQTKSADSSKNAAWVAAIAAVIAAIFAIASSILAYLSM
jgi:hypothetical protein